MKTTLREMSIDNYVDHTGKRPSVGQTFNMAVGAPGIGHIVYRVCYYDRNKVYYKLHQNKSRILDPSETR